MNELMHILGLCPDHIGNLTVILYYFTFITNNPVAAIQSIYAWITQKYKSKEETDDSETENPKQTRDLGRTNTDKHYLY